MKKTLTLVLVLALIFGCVNFASAEEIKNFRNYETQAREMETFCYHYSQAAVDLNVLSNCYEHLLTNDSKGQLIPAAAKDFSSPDGGQTWVFHLKEGITWVDYKGEYMADCTSEDWLTGLEWVLNYAKNKSANTSMPIEMITGAADYYNYTKELTETEGEDAAKALGLSSLKGVYDFQLDQFGIRRDPDEPLTTAALRMLAQNPLPAGDNAFDDLRPAGARVLNARIQTLPDTWYFSIPCCRTLPRLLTHDQKPDTAMTPLLWPFSAAMGRDSAGVPRDWLPNDGLVNTISARYPAGAPHADFAPGQTPERGVWQVLPVEPLDHLAAIGGVMNNGVVRTRLFYRRVMALLDAAAAADSAHSCEVCPKPGILS